MENTKISSYTLLKNKSIELEKILFQYYQMIKETYSCFSKKELDDYMKENLDIVIEHISYLSNTIDK